MNLKLAWSILADTFSKWNEHKAIRMGAALAYCGSESGTGSAGCLFGPIAAPVPGQTARVVQTLTADLNNGLHANQPHADSQRPSKTI